MPKFSPSKPTAQNREHEMKYCAICGKSFEINPHTRMKKYCSDECSDLHKHPKTPDARIKHGRRRGENLVERTVPEAVWRERARVLAEMDAMNPLDLFMGMPPPSRSALAKP